MIRTPILLASFAAMILVGAWAAIDRAQAQAQTQTPGGPFGLRAAPTAGLLPRDARGAIERPDELIGLEAVRDVEAELADLVRTCRPWADGASVVVRHAGGGRVRVAEPLRSDSGQFTGRRVWYVVERVPVAVRDPFGWWLFDRAGRVAARRDDGGLRPLAAPEGRGRTEAFRARLDALLLGFGGLALESEDLEDPVLCDRVGGPVEVPAR
jgi:hypothetical protein